MSVGFKIKKLREEWNLSQNKLAMELDISQSELSKIENGRAKKIDFYFMMKVCTFFNKDFVFFSIEKEMVESNNGRFDAADSLNIIVKEMKKIVEAHNRKDEQIRSLIERKTKKGINFR